MCIYEPVTGKPPIEMCERHGNDCSNCPYHFNKEQEYLKERLKEINKLTAEVAEREAELRAKGIDPKEYIASRPMGKFVASGMK